jgi:hypothetical protein
VAWADPVRQVAFDPAGGQLLVVSTNSTFRDQSVMRWGEVQVLDAGTGRPLTPRLAAAREVLDARFTPDGRAVEAVLASGSVVRWACGPADDSPALLARLAAVQTGRELDPSGTFVPLPPERLIGEVAALRAERPDRFRPAAGAPDTVADLSRLIGAAPNDPTLYARRARAHDWAGNFAAAEADWSRAIELDPGRPRWQFERGVVRANRRALSPWVRPDESRQLWDAGVADLVAVIDRVPLDSDDGLVLSEVVWAVVKDPAAGADRFRSAARLAESARAVWLGPAELTTLGLARYRVGRHPGAVEALTAGDTLPPGHPRNLAIRAMAHHRLGNAAEAARLLGEARRAAGRPESSWDAEAARLVREAEQTIAGGAREVAPPPRLVGRRAGRGSRTSKPGFPDRTRQRSTG